MKTPHQTSPSESEAIEATAAAWLAQRADRLSDSQLAEFTKWRDADPRHAAAVARLEQTLALLGQLREYRPAARMHPDRDLLAAPPPPVRFRPVLASVGLLVAALAVAAVWWWPGSVAPPLNIPQQYATTTGGYQRITLKDGSVIELNADSEVQVSYDPGERRVQLVKGEAHFSVVKDLVRPFWVEAGAVKVRAVGTAFNVRLGPTEIEVLVTEGRVEVDKDGAGPPPYVLLEAGQRWVFAQQYPVADPVVEKMEPTVMRNALAWQDKLLIFADQPLAEVIALFNHYNYVQLELADEELAFKKVGGSLRANNVEGFVSWLKGDGEILIERPEPDRIVLRKAP